jgi:hypothetical protein
MGYYRLYFLNAGGGFARCVELFSDGDENALAEARPLADGAPMELWERSRLVACLTGEGAWTAEPHSRWSGPGPGYVP